MRQMTISLLRCLLVAPLGLLLAACSSNADEPRITTVTRVPGASSTAPFVGTIRLLEYTYLLGIRSTDYVTLTFDGPRLRREVRAQSFADSTQRYGIITDLRTDSVVYYVQNDTRNVHCRLSRRDYLARVAANEPILASLDLKPYSTIFEPLAAATPGLSSAALPGPVLRRLNCRGLVFLLSDQTRCETLYSELVRVPKPALAYIEHNTPAALPTLALTVHYVPPPQAQGSGLVSRLKQGLKDIFAHHSEFESLEPRVAARAFELPAGSTNAGSAEDLEEILRAERSSSHHHDFD